MSNPKQIILKCFWRDDLIEIPSILFSDMSGLFLHLPYLVVVNLCVGFKQSAFSLLFILSITCIATEFEHKTKETVSLQKCKKV